MDLILTFFTALLLTTALIPISIKYSGNWRLMWRLEDVPGAGRKVHTQPIRRVGGICIIFSVFIAVSYWMTPLEGAWRELWGLCVGSIILAIFGFLDDCFDLNYKLKFLGQILAILPLLFSGIFFESVPLLGVTPAAQWLALPLTFCFMLGVINAVNLADGLDGLAAGIMVLSLALIAFFAVQSGQHDVALISVGVIGGLLGFLRFNTHPARAFMGDSGSQFLGFVTAAVAIKVTQYDAIAVSPLLPLLLIGLPVMDTLLVIALRVYHHRPPFQADKNHTHHQLLKLGLLHYEAVAVIYLLQAALLSVAWFFRYENDSILLGSYLLFCGGVLGLIWLGRRKHWRLHPELAPVGRENRNQFLRRFEWFYVHAPRVIEVVLGLFFIAVALRVETATPVLANIAPGLAAAGGILWVLQGVTRLPPPAVTRVLVYSVGAVLLYALLIDKAYRPVFNTAIDVYLALALLILLLAIRMTRREVFRLDTQDLLVLMFVLVVPALPMGGFTDIDLGRLTLRFAVILYCCEYLLSKKMHDYRLLNTATIVSMLLLARIV
ncbi:MAG: hypothetical protein DRR06_11180 [Gammaproteobacteria bacterium]|nr:MAG: hypothetical protein DRR06_11180 [Gammaproteobacteria bacterium]RLA50660.1 MAG: hypothetical protein DRR42_12515 [Gammaproteobacteria bacterium]